MIFFLLVIVIPICLMLLSYALVSQKKEKFWGWFGWSCLLVGVFFWLLNGISLRFLNPAYYMFKYQCKYNQKYIIHNQQYYEFIQELRRDSDKLSMNNGVYFSKLANKNLDINLWHYPKEVTAYSWGIKTLQIKGYYGNILYATTTTYAYPYYTLGLGWGSRNGFEFGFKKQEISCYDLEQK